MPYRRALPRRRRGRRAQGRDRITSGIKGAWGKATWSTVTKKAGVDWEAIARDALQGDRLEEEIARHLKPAPVIRAFRPMFAKETP